MGQHDVLVFLALLSTSYGQGNLKRRVQNLEYMFSSFRIQIQDDIDEMNKMINSTLTSALASSSGYNGGSNDGDAGPAQTDELKEILVKMELFVANQNEIFSVLHTAFADEKSRTRKMTMIKADEDERDSKVGMETGRSLQRLGIRLDRLNQQAFENENTTDQMLYRLSEVEEILEELGERLVILEHDGVVAAAVPGVSPRPRGPPCPPGWSLRDDVCYMYVANETVMFDVANMRCHDFGGILAEPDSKTALENVIDLIGDNVWLGATDEVTDGQWIWLDSKKPLSYLKWEKGQPNNYGGKQDCLEIYNGNMNDETCTTSNHFVCQRNAGK